MTTSVRKVLRLIRSVGPTKRWFRKGSTTDPSGRSARAEWILGHSLNTMLHYTISCRNKVASGGSQYTRIHNYGRFRPVTNYPGGCPRSPTHKCLAIKYKPVAAGSILSIAQWVTSSYDQRYRARELTEAATLPTFMWAIRTSNPDQNTGYYGVLHGFPRSLLALTCSVRHIMLRSLPFTSFPSQCSLIVPLHDVT
jgi:hypothetical protein